MSLTTLKRATDAIAPSLQKLQARFLSNPDLPGVDILIDIAVLIATADGTIDEQEQEALQKTIRALVGASLTPAQVAREISSSVDSIKAIGPTKKAEHLGASLRALETVEDGLRFGAIVAYISQGLSSEERSVLVHIADAAQLPQEQLNVLLKEVRRSLNE
jgi:tellurite resistance protein